MSCFILVFLCCIVVTQSQFFDTAQHENWQSLQSDYCNGARTSRVNHGTEARLCEFPWIARLSLWVPHKMVLECAGTILNQRTILTAAHCFFYKGTSVKLRTVILGDWSQRTTGDCSNGICAPREQVLRPREIIIHADFNSEGTFLNDIALVRLESDIQWNNCTRPICMPKGNLLQSDFAGQTARVAGWGVANLVTNEISKILRKTTLRVTDSNQCQPSVICAFGHSQTAEVCHGDSGAPLMIDEVDHSSPNRLLRDYVIGIVSKNENCGAYNVPGKFTRVSFYAQWIMDNLILNKRDFIPLK